MERQKVFWVVLSVSVFVVVVLVAGAFLLRPRPGATPGSVTPLSDGGTQVYEYQSEVPPTTSTPPAGKQENTETLHFYIGEGQPKPEASPAPSTPSTTAPSATSPSPVVPPAATATAPAASSAAPTAPAVTPAPKKTAPTATASRVAPKPSVRVPEYWIQTGSYKSQTKAEDLAALLTGKGLAGRIFSYAVQGTTWYRVRVGPYTSRGEADKFLSEVKKLQGLEASYISQVGPVRVPVN